MLANAQRRSAYNDTQLDYGNDGRAGVGIVHDGCDGGGGGRKRGGSSGTTASYDSSRINALALHNASSCRLCLTPFTPVKRRHHCRSCGRSVCDGCSPHRRPLPNRGYATPVRHCALCEQAARGIAVDTAMGTAGSGSGEQGGSSRAGESESRLGGVGMYLDAAVHPAVQIYIHQTEPLPPRQPGQPSLGVTEAAAACSAITPPVAPPIASAGTSASSKPPPPASGARSAAITPLALPTSAEGMPIVQLAYPVEVGFGASGRPGGLAAGGCGEATQLGSRRHSKVH